jgi:hypothetical protein
MKRKKLTEKEKKPVKIASRPVNRQFFFDIAQSVAQSPSAKISSPNGTRNRPVGDKSPKLATLSNSPPEPTGTERSRAEPSAARRPAPPRQARLARLPGSAATSPTPADHRSRDRFCAPGTWLQRQRSFTPES